jgi:hypothetical protein
MKIALCFLSYGDIEQQAVWSSFLENVSKEKYTILLHRADGIQTSWAPNCIVIPTQPTEWATFSLVRVQQQLFTTACIDPEVTKCILLSGDSIPIYPFQKIYDTLLRDTKGYISEYPIKESKKHEEATVSRTCWPKDKQWKWTITDQWVVLNRMHVGLLQEHWDMLVRVFEHSKCPDEHVYIVFFNGFGVINTFHKQCFTVRDWKLKTSSCSLKHRPLPTTYHTHNFTPNYLKWIYSKGGLFLRKVCTTTTITMNWSLPQPIIPVKRGRCCY